MTNKLAVPVVVVTLLGAVAVPTMIFAQPPGPPPQGFGPRADGPGGPGGRGPGGPGFGRGPGGPGFGGPQATVTGAPYSGLQTSESVQTLSDGTKITHNDSTKFYRDSQGRVRTENTVSPPAGSNAQTHTMITIFDPVSGTISRIDPQAMTVDKTTIPTGGGTRPAPPAPPAGATQPAVQTLDLGSKAINGLNATGTRTTVTIPAGAFGNSAAITSVHEVWTSTDLKVPVLVTDSDPRSGTRTTQLTGVIRSEPDASLFVAPSNYTATSHARGPRGGGPPR